jgi:ABC-type glycerol-3-phosphate transport system substrate-binding protein
MTHRIWSRVLCALLVAALMLTTACSGNTPAATTAAATTAAATTAAATTAATTKATTAATTKVTTTLSTGAVTTAATSSATTTPAAAEAAPHITWYANNGICTDNDMVMEFLEEYILGAINVDVTINNMASADYTEKVPVMLNAGQEMDMIICNASFHNAIADMVKINALQPVTKYMDNIFSDTVAILPENIWKDATYRGEIWGIPLYKNRVRNYDFLYNKDLAETLGLGEYMADLQWDYMPDLMEDLYTVKDAMDAQGFDYQYVTTMSGANAIRMYGGIDILQGDNASKAYASTNIDGEDGCLDFGYDEVFNAYGTNDFRDWCHLAYQYVQDKMIPPDDTKNIDPDNALRTNGELFGWSSSGLTSIDPHSFSNDYETVLIRSAKAVGLANASNGVYCIPASSKNPDAAAKLMNLTNSDPYLATCMRYGIEGTHWIYDTDGQVTLEFPGSRNADASNRGYYYWYGVFWGNLFIVSPAKQSAVATFVDDMYALNEVGSVVSKYYGFIFDVADCIEEVASIDNVVGQYLAMCGNGRMPSEDEIDKSLDEFNAALEANGLQKVLDAAQAQLDAYAEENGLAKGSR